MCSYYFAGGKHCEFRECFANRNDNCILLRVSYNEFRDEVCPFYKKGDAENFGVEADIQTINYANQRVATLEAKIAAAEELAMLINEEYKRLFVAINEKKRKARAVIREAEKEKENAQKRIRERIAERKNIKGDEIDCN